MEEEENRDQELKEEENLALNHPEGQGSNGKKNWKIFLCFFDIFPPC